jgi:hypothetical protein
MIPGVRTEKRIFSGRLLRTNALDLILKVRAVVSHTELALRPSKEAAAPWSPVEL